MSWNKGSKNSRSRRGISKENELWKSIRHSLMHAIDETTFLCIMYGTQYFKVVDGQKTGTCLS